MSGIFEVSPECVAQQLDSVFTDIAPDAVKVGMVSSSDIIKVIASQLTRYNAKNIVVDPVMVATSGSRLIGESAIETLIGAQRACEEQYLSADETPVELLPKQTDDR